jgi:hypothetical protein
MSKEKSVATGQPQDAEITTSTQEAESEQPSLSINDLALVANIIDLGLKRGAFHGPEASQVGSIYDKVSSFVKFVTAQNEAQQSAEQVSD